MIVQIYRFFGKWHAKARASWFLAIRETDLRKIFAKGILMAYYQKIARLGAKKGCFSKKY